MHKGILSVIGNTPLVRLKRLMADAPFEIYAKLESLNPGGSIKDRPAAFILERAIEDGIITPDTVVIESSSGNMGIGLAQTCSCYGLRFICVVDPKTTAQNKRLIRAYGAEVDLVEEPDPGTGEFLQARINRVRDLLGSIKNSFWPNQYSNVYNPLSHHDTMHEIVKALGGDVDYLLCATSTCGTMRGCAEYIRANGLKTRIIAVDAVGSVIFGGRRAKRLIPGHGAAVVPELFSPDLVENFIHITDLECVIGCRRLAHREAILSGGSSGAVVMALEKIKEEIPRAAKCVAIFPDRGERYLDTIFSDEWVIEHFGDVSHHWNDLRETETWAPQLHATATY